jgi:hypothetical protein
MSTIRQLILADITTALEGITGVGVVKVNDPLPLEASPTLPSFYVFSEPASKQMDESSLGYREWIFRVRIEGVAAVAADPEALVAVVETAMTADGTRGGNADMTELTDIEITNDFDEAANVRAIVMTYEIRYEAAVGAI